MMYKGYTAKIEADTEAGILHGRIVGIPEIITFEGESLPQLLEDFHAAVDDYLEDCQERGVKPTAPASGQHPLKLPPQLHAIGKVFAKDSGTNFNSYVVSLIAKDLEEKTDIPVTG